MLKIYHFLIAALFFAPNLSKASLSIDSIGTEVKNGKKVILYKVEAKETYYSIAKKYNVTHFELMEFNESRLLQVGEVIKVPTQVIVSNSNTNPQAPVYRPSSNAAEQSTETTYTVKAKDNLNLIAKLYQTTADEIKALNNLSSNNLQIGQLLKIPGSNRASSTPITTPTPALPNASNNNVEPETPARPITRKYKATVTHKVKSGETLGHIAQKYDMSVDAVKKLNKLKNNNLQIGQSIKVEVMKTQTIYPSSRTASNRNNANTTNNNASTSSANVSPNSPVNNTSSVTPRSAEASSFEHTVVAGETIYSIAKKYNLTTYQLTTSNNLSSNSLSVGQKLIIKESSSPVNSSVASVGTNEDNTLDDGTLNDPKLKQPPSKFGLTRFDEKGTAVWITDPDLDESKMLVLHRTAPIGTIIRITNPTTNRSAFAKVVGKFTENETTKDVIIVVTKIVADAVGALDKRFYCNINYGAVDND